MEAQPSPNPTLFQRLVLEDRALQFTWFIGHLGVILCVLKYIFLWIHLKSYDGMAQFYYRTTFISAAATYSIAVYKILCFRVWTSQGILGRALGIAAFETVQYFALAITWLFIPLQLPAALFPYCIYSILHVAVYTRSNLTHTLKTNMVPAHRAKLKRAVATKVVPALRANVKRELEANLLPTLQANMKRALEANTPPTLQTNPNLTLQATAFVRSATVTYDAEMVPASDHSADKITDMSMSVMSVPAQTILSFFLPQWIYPLFHLATTLTAPPMGTSSAERHTESAPDTIARNLGVFLKTYYDVSMSIVASLEIFIWFRLLFSTVTFQRQSWIMIILYTVFLRARYDQSTHFRIAFAQLETKAEGLLDTPNTPLIVRQAWKKAWEVTRALTSQLYHASDLTKYTGGDSALKKLT